MQVSRGWGLAILPLLAGGACTSSLPSPEVTGSVDAGAAEGGADTAVPPVDAASEDAAAPDADAEAGPVAMARFSGHVDYNGPVVGATVTVLAPTAASTTTDASGDFFFYFPVGSAAVVKVEAPNLFPMIRGEIITSTPSRIRVFYLAGPPEIGAAQSLNKSFDPSKGIVEADFRNATVGGYGVSLTATGGGAVTPGFGIALDGMGNPQLATATLAGGDGTTLLLGDVPTGTATFAGKGPDGGTVTPCDAPSLPIQANVVTWFDFEAGDAGCQ